MDLTWGLVPPNGYCLKAFTSLLPTTTITCIMYHDFSWFPGLTHTMFIFGQCSLHQPSNRGDAWGSETYSSLYIHQKVLPYKNSTCIANILDISPKLTHMCSPSPLVMDEPIRTPLAPFFPKVNMFGFVIYSSNRMHLLQCRSDKEEMNSTNNWFVSIMVVHLRDICFLW